MTFITNHWAHFVLAGEVQYSRSVCTNVHRHDSQFDGFSLNQKLFVIDHMAEVIVIKLVNMLLPSMRSPRNVTGSDLLSLIPVVLPLAHTFKGLTA